VKEKKKKKVRGSVKGEILPLEGEKLHSGEGTNGREKKMTAAIISRRKKIGERESPFMKGIDKGSP